MSIKMTIHRVEQNGICSLSAKEGEVLVISFDDGTLTERPLSQKSLLQLLRMKMGQSDKKPSPAAVPVSGNGPTPVQAK